MAILKDNFGYALISAKSEKIVKNINVSDIISDMKAELKKSMVFRGSYCDNIIMLLFNSMFQNKHELTKWLLDILAKRNIDSEMLNQKLFVVQYYSTENVLEGYEDISNTFLLHIKSKKHYYKVPLLTGESFTNGSFNSNKLISQKELINPFFAILKMGEELSNMDTKKTASFDNFDKENTQLYNIYNLYNSSKKISSKSLDDVKNAIAVINTYICLNFSSFDHLNVEEFLYKLSQYNELILTMNKPATKDQIDKVKEYRSYLISIVKDIDFNKMLESFEYDYSDLFKNILSYCEAWYLAVTRYEDDTDNNRYKELSDTEKMRVICEYFASLRNKGEIDYKIVSDSNKMILRLLNYCNLFDNPALIQSHKEKGNSRSR